jgi:hypothetical protein
VAPIITGIIVHFRFHIRCISIHKLLYFNLFSSSSFSSSYYYYYVVIVAAAFVVVVVFSCHGPFLPGTSLEPTVIPTSQPSNFTLQCFPYCV